MKEEYIKLTLPIPPSVNKCFAGYPKRHKSNDYKSRIQKAEFELAKQVKYKISGTEWLIIEVEALTPLFYKNKKKKKWDLDNILKPLLDFLGSNIEGFDDRYIKTIIARKIDSNQNIVNVKIKELCKK